MSEFFLDNMIWIILYPLWLFILIGAGRFFAVKFSKSLITVLTLIGALAGIVFSLGAVPYVFSVASVDELLFTFIKLQKFILQLGIVIDKPALVCLVLLYVVSFFVQIFSFSYMREEPKYYRYCAYLNLFNFGMSSFLVAPNLFQSYIGWEVIGVVSYLLIGFKYDNIFKSKAAQKVFLINRIGDVALLAGILSMMYIMITYAQQGLGTLSFSDFNLITSVTYAHTNELTFLGLCLLFLIGIFTKSVQFPFQPWLLAAMEAPTPVSALIHSATLVVAGVFLTLRLIPLFSLSQAVMVMIVTVGIFTAIFSSLCAVAQNKVKSVLAYSTSANLGLLFALIAFGDFNLVLMYLFFHGIVKASMFLSYGSCNNEYNQQNGTIIPPSFILASFILAGLAFWGLNLKEMMFDTFKYSEVFVSLFLLIAFLASVYLFRICSLYSLPKSKSLKPFELFSIWGLLLISILPGVLIKKIDIPFYVSLAGALLAIFLTFRLKNKTFDNSIIKLVAAGFYLDKLYSVVFVKIFNLVARFFNYIEKRLNDYTLLTTISRFLVRFAAFIEKNIFEFPVKLLVYCSRFASREFEIAQTKNAQTYIAYGALIIGIIFTTIILTYSFILNFLGGMG